MKFSNFAAFLCVSWGATLACAGNAGEVGDADEGESGAEAEALGEVSSALQSGPGKHCGPKNPLGDYCKDCKRTKIGNPSWEPTGVTAIAGQIGSTTPDLLFSFLSELTGPQHAFDANDFIIGPGAPHAGPYDDELARFAIRKGLVPKQTFRTSEFTAPAGVVILVNLVPSKGAPIGSSVDFASGPIIPNALFPFAVDGDLFRNGEIYDPFFDGTYAGYPGMNPPISKDGPSHFPWFFAENSFFGPPATPPTGKYDFKLVIKDSTGAGWSLEVPFTVKK